MTFYILRHGKSPSPAEAGVRSDAERPLAEQGREDIRAAAREIAARGGKPAIILHSPLKRAVQSAAEAASVLHPARGVRAYEPLSNQMTGEALFACLEREFRGLEFVALGHQPQLGEMVAYLTGQAVEIRPGGLVAISRDERGASSLLWSRNP